MPEANRHVRVLAAGLQTTVQDLGRPGFAHLGVSTSGAADAAALRCGNRLTRNPPDAPGLEMTLVGGTFEFDSACRVALTGSDFAANLDGASLENWTAFRVRPGQVLRCGPTRAGARCYVCVDGGFDVPRLLGSASTHLTTALGGWQGRALATGDILPLGPPAATANAAPRRLRSEFIQRLARREVLRVTAGAQADAFGDDVRKRFVTSSYQVTEAANRMGLRLLGPALERLTPNDLITEGVPLGTLQIPPDGQPILSFVEHQTTGGYPKLATVIAADLYAVGQLRPRDSVRFEFVTIERALELLAAHVAAFAASALEGP